MTARRVTIGYHNSHEQHAPSRLLAMSQRAHAAGFQCGMCSDHFYPWSERQGHSGFAWSWLGAAMQAVPEWAFGMVCAPGQRYHPAIIAQAAATLAEMAPGRLWCAFGSGQYLNEHLTGERWPTKAERNQRLAECVAIIRALWAGETVNHRGRWFNVEEAKLYTRPPAPPQIIGPALTPETARFLGGWADGLITVNQPHEKLRAIVDAFREGGGAGKPLCLQVHIAYAETEADARAAAFDQWRTNVFESRVLSDLRSPAQFDALGVRVRPEDLDDGVRISSDLAQHAAWLQEYIDLGFDRLYLHEVGPDQERFIDAFGARVIPQLA